MREWNVPPGAFATVFQRGKPAGMIAGGVILGRLAISKGRNG